MNILAIVEDAASQYQLVRFSILGRLYIVMLTRVCERSRTKARGFFLRRSCCARRVPQALIVLPFKWAKY
jgi:hypothetical protein